MKRLFVFAVFAFALTPPARAQWWRMIAPQIEVELPAVRRVTGVDIQTGTRALKPQFQIGKYNFVVRNGVQIQMTAVIYAHCEEIAVLGPGGIAADNDREVQMHNETIPIMAFYYRDYEDLNGQRHGNLVGIAREKITFTSGRPDSQAITFDENDILRTDGEIGYRYNNRWEVNFPLPIADLAEKPPIHLPRKPQGSTTGMQIGNASLFTVRFGVSGQTLTFPPGTFSCLEWKTIGRFRAARSIQVNYFQKLPSGEFLSIKTVRDRNFFLNVDPRRIEGRQLVIGAPSYGVHLY